jgi:hypothetical protein
MSPATPAEGVRVEMVFAPDALVPMEGLPVTEFHATGRLVMVDLYVVVPSE